jgi:hypothetical protein
MGLQNSVAYIAQDQRWDYFCSFRSNIFFQNMEINYFVLVTILTAACDKLWMEASYIQITIVSCYFVWFNL